MSVIDNSAATIKNDTAVMGISTNAAVQTKSLDPVILDLELDPVE